jgi:hypothetical protein
MERTAEIANPDASEAEENLPGSPAALAEQRVGGGAVGGGLVAVGGHPGNLGFEQRDAQVALGLRIGSEILRSEATRRVPSRSWEIGFFHYDAASQAKRLAVNRQGG